MVQTSKKIIKEPDFKTMDIDFGKNNLFTQNINSTDFYMKYKAVLFDLDGTLLDTALDIMNACNHTLEKYGYKALDEKLLKLKLQPVCVRC